MTTETAKQLANMKAELKFIGREVSDMNTADFEAVDALMAALRNIGDSISEIELDAQPSTEDALIAA